MSMYFSRVDFLLKVDEIFNFKFKKYFNKIIRKYFEGNLRKFNSLLSSFEKYKI